MEQNTLILSFSWIKCQRTRKVENCWNRGKR